MSNRYYWSLHAMVLFLLITGALLLQKIYNLEPCPLCVFQRVVFMGGFVVAVLALIHNPQRVGQLIYSLLYVLFNLCGLGIAGRHIWLQNLPADQVPACGPSLDYLLQVLPVTQVIKDSLIGSGNCAKVDFLLLGQTLSVWSFICFFILAFSSIYWAKKRR